MPLRKRLIRLAHANPELRPHLLPLIAPNPSRLSASGWDAPPTYEDFRKDPQVGKLYGAYTFWLMHHDGSPSQKRMADKIEKALDRKGFNQWGVVIDRWPEAAREYLALCRKHGVRPEAVR